MKKRGSWLGWLTRPFSVRSLSDCALIGFLGLSVLATGLGFADLRAAGTDTGELSALELGVTVATTLFVVSAMAVALHRLVTTRSWWVRIVSFFAYLIFAVWTVGFGYGFFWKELAGQEFTARQFERAISDLSGSIGRTSEALTIAEQATAESALLAATRADTEAREGRTCANRPASTPGEGPLMRSRFAFAERAGNLGDEVRNQWIRPVADQRARLKWQVDALVKRATPPASVQIPAQERAVLEKLARVQRLPSAERRELFDSVYEDARAFSASANDLRALHAEPFAARLTQLAADVGPDPARPGSADAARVNDPGYCWDVVLHEKLLAAAGQLRAVEEVATPRFEFLEGAKATRAAFFGLITWIASPLGIHVSGGEQFAFDDKAFLALFASLAVDLGIVFLTLMGAARKEEEAVVAPKGQGAPKPPRLSGILD